MRRARKRDGLTRSGSSALTPLDPAFSLEPHLDQRLIGHVALVGGDLDLLEQARRQAQRNRGRARPAGSAAERARLCSNRDNRSNPVALPEGALFRFVGEDGIGLRALLIDGLSLRSCRARRCGFSPKEQAQASSAPAPASQFRRFANSTPAPPVRPPPFAPLRRGADQTSPAARRRSWRRPNAARRRRRVSVV